MSIPAHCGCRMVKETYGYSKRDLRAYLHNVLQRDQLPPRPLPHTTALRFIRQQLVPRTKDTPGLIPSHAKRLDFNLSILEIRMRLGAVRDALLGLGRGRLGARALGLGLGQDF